MVSTIGNPLSWGARLFGGAGREVSNAAAGLGGTRAMTPELRAIGTNDIRAALHLGLADFAALRTDVAAMCLLYPVIGAVLVWFALNQSVVFLVFPMVAGFALVGPAVAVGLYEMSRVREAGGTATWADGFRVLSNPSFGAILVLGLMLVGLFTLWLLAAWGIHAATMGEASPDTAAGFARAVLTTPEGWAMILIGIPVGFVFAALVLAVSVISFPMLVDRPVGLPMAVTSSVRLARANPRTVAAWGLIVATGLVLGAIPALLGLAIVLPVLGHATWHLYRRAVGWS